MNSIKQIRRYLDVQLNKEDTEIYLDTDDYELILNALEECVAVSDRLKAKKKELVQGMYIINSEFGDDLTPEQKAYNAGVKKGIDFINEEITRWMGV